MIDRQTDKVIPMTPLSNFVCVSIMKYNKLTNKEGINLQLKGQFKDALQFNTVSYKTKRLNTILY